VTSTSTSSRSFDRPRADLGGRGVLVTGGTGSFGRAMVRALLNDPRPPKRLVVFSRDEQKQDAMAHELQALGPDLFNRLRFFIGDVRNVSRLELAMRDIDVVLHAAALKIVPTAEYNPFECVMTNIHGAENVVMAALRTGVKKVIGLSTDKAASPINLYGATKLAADKIFVAANNLSGESGARFSVVRYGNVIGSRGSVVPLFQRLISEGADFLPITDERMTRFWIALHQGIAFVLSSLAMMQGGEIFVPRIPSMRVVDIARVMAPRLPHKIIGIRPGEKLHEVMITEDDARMTVALPDRYLIMPPGDMELRGHYGNLGATAVREDFRYGSEINEEWLDAAGLTQLLALKQPLPARAAGA
jgi:UDP-N-acetylglucosamine 4,6-dehydratase/5-epimerase